MFVQSAHTNAMMTQSAPVTETIEPSTAHLMQVRLSNLPLATPPGFEPITHEQTLNALKKLDSTTSWDCIQYYVSVDSRVYSFALVA
jgi:hypothetical protein